MAKKHEMCLAGGAKPKLRRARRIDIGKAKQRAFLQALSETCNISEAARRAGIHRRSVYYLRDRDAGFRAGCTAAIREAYGTLELMLLDRAINGTVKTVTRATGSVETIHEYPNRLGLALLQLHMKTVAAVEAQTQRIDVEAVRARLSTKFDMICRRLDRERAESAGGSEGGGGAGGGAGAAGAILPGLPGGPPHPPPDPVDGPRLRL